MNLIVKMRKKILIIAGVVLIIAGVLFFSFISSSVTGRAIENSHLFTRAICNETNFCQDYEITCQGNRVLNVTPILGAVVQHSPEWEDYRNKTDIEKLCE